MNGQHYQGPLQSQQRRAGRRRLVTNLHPDNWPDLAKAVWERAARVTTTLDEAKGRIAAWRPSTREAGMREYGCWLGFLTAQGALPPNEDPAGRITPEHVRAYVMSMAERCSSVTRVIGVARLVMIASALFPDHDWTWLRRVRAGLQQLAKPSRRKEGRVVPQRDLRRLGQHLMTYAADNMSMSRLAAALRHRDGLLIAILALAPIRRANLVALEIGRQFVKTERGWLISLPPEEMKAPRAFEAPLPGDLGAAIERYLQVHRPHLLQRSGSAATARLWIGETGKPISPLCAWQIVTKHTRRHLGVAVNPHLARDCAVTTLGEEDPERVWMAPAVLGQRSHAVTHRHYNHARRREAFRRFQDLRSSGLGSGGAAAGRSSRNVAPIWRSGTARCDLRTLQLRPAARGVHGGPDPHLPGSRGA